MSGARQSRGYFITQQARTLLTEDADPAFCDDYFPGSSCCASIRRTPSRSLTAASRLVQIDGSLRTRLVGRAFSDAPGQAAGVVAVGWLGWVAKSSGAAPSGCRGCGVHPARAPRRGATGHRPNGSTVQCTIAVVAWHLEGQRAGSPTLQGEKDKPREQRTPRAATGGLEVPGSVGSLSSNGKAPGSVTHRPRRGCTTGPWGTHR